ncbi:MAG: elongation factor P [Chitinophagales bacterium]
MASTSDIKNGLCLKHNSDIYSVVEFQHVKPGKGPAFVRCKIKSLTSGKVLDNTWPSGHKIETVRVERRKFQYSYKDDTGLQFMNTETWEQIALQEEAITNADLLMEGVNVDVLVLSEDETILTCELPQSVTQKVAYTEPGLKGDTATNASKPAKLESGAEVQVPLFINEGDSVRIDSTTRSYIERVKQ